MEALKNKLKQYMEEQGINQSELARRLGISRQAVSLWVKGTANPKISLLERAANVLGCSPADLIDETDQDRELMKLLENMTDEDKKDVIRFLRKMQGLPPADKK